MSESKPFQSGVDKKMTAYQPPLAITKIESLNYHYQNLRNKFLQSEHITRDKTLTAQKRCKEVSIKYNYVVAVKLFNSLPNNLKVLHCNKKQSNKKKINKIEFITFNAAQTV